VDFIGIGMIAWVPVALIEGAANRKRRSYGPALLARGARLGSQNIGFYCEDRER